MIELRPYFFTGLIAVCQAPKEKENNAPLLRIPDLYHNYKRPKMKFLYIIILMTVDDCSKENFDIAD